MVLRKKKSDEKDQKILANRARGGSLWGLEPLVPARQLDSLRVLKVEE